MIHSKIQEVTERIASRSQSTRNQYMSRMHDAIEKGINRSDLSCGNMAHACAAASLQEKLLYTKKLPKNIGIVTAYNDMLSAHQPFETFPQRIKNKALSLGATAQVAGGVPAMCDGVTQGQAGMELSLFSRDVIAMASAVALSHQCFDAAVFLGVCDKIIPGMTIAAASFGHIPIMMIPAGPMPSGLPNEDKAAVRQQFASGQADKEALLKAEMASYHSPGTCTFYGTANTNQMIMEIMGMHLPGASFVNPGTPMRDALTEKGVEQILKITAGESQFTPACEILSVKNFVNAIVGLLASGGSTNLVIHIIAMARAAGIILDVSDLADLSKHVPLLMRVYPNGMADVNAFHQAGGMSVFIAQLLEAGLLHQEVKTVVGNDLSDYTIEPSLTESNDIIWRNALTQSRNTEVLAHIDAPFSKTGGLVLLEGNLGRSVIKTSAIKKEQYVIKAPAKVFHSQEAVSAAFKAGELEQDFVCVLRFQGPKANGMPELHALTPVLGALQAKGYKVALVTDGRMSGASGKVPAAIHVSPEALAKGNIAKVKDGDIIELNAQSGTLNVVMDDINEFYNRDSVTADLQEYHQGCGRELFDTFRSTVTLAEQGANVFFKDE